MIYIFCRKITFQTIIYLHSLEENLKIICINQMIYYAGY